MAQGNIKAPIFLSVPFTWQCIHSSHYRKWTLVEGTIMRPIQKRHSWPPLRVMKSPKSPLPIDRDPFAYFVSPVLDEEISQQSRLIAGITNRRRSRSLPSIHLRSGHGQTATDRARRRIAKLKKWIARMQLAYFHSSSLVPVSSTTSPVPRTVTEDPTPMDRGRDVRVIATSRVRAKTRTPPRKPRAWRQPSDKIWPVAEEMEEVGLGIRELP